MAAGDTLQGWRRGDGKVSETLFAPGDYLWDADAGEWWIRPPRGSMGGLDTTSGTGHKVVEHKDGTITVSPSILTDVWHGHLEHGIWREV